MSRFWSDNAINRWGVELYIGWEILNLVGARKNFKSLNGGSLVESTSFFEEFSKLEYSYSVLFVKIGLLRTPTLKLLQIFTAVAFLNTVLSFCEFRSYLTWILSVVSSILVQIWSLWKSSNSGFPWLVWFLSSTDSFPNVIKPARLFFPKCLDHLKWINSSNYHCSNCCFNVACFLPPGNFLGVSPSQDLRSQPHTRNVI